MPLVVVVRALLWTETNRSTPASFAASVRAFRSARTDGQARSPPPMSVVRVISVRMPIAFSTAWSRNPMSRLTSFS